MLSEVTMTRPWCDSHQHNQTCPTDPEVKDTTAMFGQGPVVAHCTKPFRHTCAAVWLETGMASWLDLVSWWAFCPAGFLGGQPHLWGPSEANPGTGPGGRSALQDSWEVNPLVGTF